MLASHPEVLLVDLSCDFSAPPRFLPAGEPEDTVVDVDNSDGAESNLRLQCLARGCPRPQYEWFRDGQWVTNLATPMEDGWFGFRVAEGNGTSRKGVAYHCTATTFFHESAAAIRSRVAIVTLACNCLAKPVLVSVCVIMHRLVFVLAICLCEVCWYVCVLLDTDQPIRSPVIVDTLVMVGGTLSLRCILPVAQPPLRVINWVNGKGQVLFQNTMFDGSFIEYDEGGRFLYIKYLSASFLGKNNYYCIVSNASGPPFRSAVGYKLNDDLRFREIYEYEREDHFYGVVGENVTFRYLAHYRDDQSYTGVGVSLTCSSYEIRVSSHQDMLTFTVPEATSSNYEMTFSCTRETQRANNLEPVQFKLTVLSKSAITPHGLHLN